MIITHEHLLKILHYDPVTGIFTWLERPVTKEKLRTDKIWNTRYASKTAGSVGNQNYFRIVISVGKKKHYIGSHRLAWFYITKQWPLTDIDHINMNVQDNRFSNLRLASRSQNNANSKPPRDNTSGKKGVCFDSSRGQWKAEIKKDGVRFHIGRFESFEEACDARRNKAFALFGEFARED